jgi:replicative DNA helicase
MTTRSATRVQDDAATDSDASLPANEAPYEGSYFAEHAADILAPDYYPSGMPELDAVIGGFRPGSLVVLAGAPMTGKSSFASQIALSMAQRAKKLGIGPVVFVSFEEGARSIAQRLVLQTGRLQDGYTPPMGFSEREQNVAREVIADLAGLPLIINEHCSESVAGISEAVERASVQPSLVIVDHLGLAVRSTSTKDEARAEMGNTVSELVRMARSQQVPVLLLSHLNRYSSGGSSSKPGGDSFPPAPAIMDLPAATMEHQASLIMALQRFSLHNNSEPRNDDPSLTLLHFLKNRTGPVSTMSLRWLPSDASFVFESHSHDNDLPF